MSDHKKAPEHWHDLSEQQRAALARRADNEIFWQGFAQRFVGWGKMAQVTLTVAALFFLLRDAAAETLNRWMDQ